MSDEYNFLTEEDMRMLKRQEEEEALEWRNLDEKAISAEIFGVNHRMTDFADHLEKMVNDNSFSDTKDMWNALMSNDLGSSGWMPSFCAKNSRLLSVDSKSVTVESEKLQGAYNACKRIYDDLMLQQQTRKEVLNMLLLLPLKNSFQLLRLEKNFVEANFDKDLYHLIDTEISGISEQLNRSWSDIYSTNSGEVYARYKAGQFQNVPLKTVIENYRKERIKDYQTDARRRGVASLIERPDGTYYVKAEMMAKLGVIDKYTSSLHDLLGVDEKLKRTVEQCAKAKTEIKESDKKLSTMECRSLNSAYLYLVDIVNAYCNSALVAYEDFQHSSNAPYCFFKNPDSFKTLKRRYSFTPDMSDPLEHGTHYKELYQMAAKAFGEHCKDFAYNRGAEEFTGS